METELLSKLLMYHKADLSLTKVGFSDAKKLSKSKGVFEIGMYIFY